MVETVIDSERPLVSIAIPTYDRLQYLKEAVASALSQTYERVEVIIGDDGPTNSIRAWCETVAMRDARVRYRRNARNLGLAGNWNALVDAARGEFITLIGDDDRLLPDFVGRMVEAARPDADVAFANHYLIDEHGRRLEVESERCTRTYKRHKLTAGLLGDAASVVWQNSVPVSSTLIRTEHVRRLRFREDLNTPELELFIRMAQEGARFVFVPDYLAEYRTHRQSLTSGGLRSEKLAEYLIPIPVAPEVEKYKREFLAPLLVDAVGRCLRQNERELARRFLRHEYYPRPRLRKAPHRNGSARLPAAGAESDRHDRPRLLKEALTVYAQGVCSALPISLGCRAYRLAQRIGRARRRQGAAAR